jgi:hypothetical protein
LRRVSFAASARHNGRTVFDPLAPARERVERAAIGVEIDIKHGPDGEVWSVQGLDRAQKRLKSAASTLAPGVRARVLREVEPRYTERSVRREWGTLVLPAPSPASVGESWRAASLVAPPGREASPTSPGRLNETCTLLSLSPDRAVVARENAFSIASLAFPGAAVEEGNIKGQATIDRATGMPVEEHSQRRATIMRRSQDASQSTAQSRPLGWTQFEWRRVFTPL